MQPILIAAGGGGSSSLLGHTMPSDAQGLVNPYDTLHRWRSMVSEEDTDAGKSFIHFCTKGGVLAHLSFWPRSFSSWLFKSSQCIHCKYLLNLLFVFQDLVEAGIQA